MRGNSCHRLALWVQLSARRFFQAVSAPARRTSTSASAGIQVTIPIYNGGRTSALVRQSKETLGQRRIEVDVAARQCPPGHRQAYSQMESAKAQIVAQRSVVAAAQLALNGVIEERKVGQRTTLDVLNAQADVLTGQVSLAQAERDSVVTSYAVLSAVGRLTACADRTSGCRVQTGRALRSGKGQVDRSAHAGRPLISDLSAVCRFQICRQADRLAANCFPAPVEAFFRKSVG